MVDPAGYADPSLVASLHDLTTTDPRTASAGTSAPMSAPAPLSLAIAAALSPSASDDAALDLADPVAAEPVQSVELVFVDERTPDYEQLLAGIGPGIAGQSTVVIMLEADRDGIEQISEALAAYDAVDVVHVVSHGRDGGVQLGATWLDAYTSAAMRQRSRDGIRVSRMERTCFSTAASSRKLPTGARSRRRSPPSLVPTLPQATI